MALQAKVGSFDTGTGAAASNVVVTGVGFQAKALIMWWNGRVGSSDAVGSAHIQRGFGFAISDSARRAVASRSEDAVGTSDTSRANYDSACVVIMNPTSAAIDGLLDFVSFDVDGFTLVVDDQFTASYRVHYLALGGDDLTNTAIGSVNTAAGTGLEPYTGVGFQPECLLFISALTATLNTPAGGGEMLISAAVSDTQQALWYGDSTAGQATMTNIGYCRGDEMFINTASGASTIRATFVSMDADGFTLTFPEIATAVPIFYLALRGGRYAVGELFTQTDTTPFSETGLSIGVPVAAMFVSAGKVEDTTDTPSAHDRWSVGAATSSSEQVAMGTWEENGTADAENATAIEHDAVYINIATTDVVQGLMSLQSMDSDGFTCVMDDADSGNAFVWYLAVGSEPSAGGSGNAFTGKFGALLRGKLG
jgi:hypothetical protein